MHRVRRLQKGILYVSFFKNLKKPDVSLWHLSSFDKKKKKLFDTTGKEMLQLLWEAYFFIILTNFLLLKSFSLYLFSNNTHTGKPFCSQSVPSLFPLCLFLLLIAKRLCPRPDSELIRCFLLHLEPSLTFGVMPWCHLNLSVCITCEHKSTHTPQKTPALLLPSKTPSLHSVALFPSQNYHISSTPNTPHILRSQPGDNESEILLLEEERRGFLLSPVPSVVIAAVRALLIGFLIFWNG